MAKTPSERLPSVGRIVYFCDEHMGDEAPAIITKVADPVVNLTVFPAYQPPILARAVRFNDSDKPVKGTWRWPSQTT